MNRVMTAILVVLDTCGEDELDMVTLHDRVDDHLGRTRLGTSLGAMYTSVERLERMKLVETRSGEELPPERGNKPRRYVSITPGGRREVNTEEPESDWGMTPQGA